jgi:hypothetical protein
MLLAWIQGTYKWWEVLEAVGVISTHADSGLIPQHKGDLNDTGDTSGHEGISEDGVDHGADHQSLRVRRHSIPSHENDNGRNEVALGAAIAAPAQPHTQQTSAPPDNTHGSVLQIIVHPGTAPAVLSKGINTTPSRNNQGVEELLAATSPAQPVLSNQQKQSQTDTVPDKRTAHDKVRQTLAKVITLAEAQRSNTTKQHLRPANHGHDLSKNTMSHNEDPANTSLARLLKMQLEIETKRNLRNQQKHQPVRKLGMSIRSKLTTLVRMTEEIGDDSDNGTDDLERNVPARANDL